MKRILIPGIFAVFFLCAGCEFLKSEVITNPDGTQTLTYEGEKYLRLAQDITGGLAQSGVPLVSLISGGVSTVLAIAIGILGKIVANRTTVAKAAVFGIENFSGDYFRKKQKILDILSADEVKPSLVAALKVLDELMPVKKNVFEVSKVLNKKNAVDNFVQKTIKNHKKGGVNG